MVLGLPRGGIPVAYEVARALHVPLDVMIVRKLGMPGHEELAMGAIASGGVTILNPEVVEIFRDAKPILRGVTAREEKELLRREELYRGGRGFPELWGRTVILCDDGLATGATMRAAVVAARHLHAARVVAAAPVGAEDTCALLRREVDELVCPLVPEEFGGVGAFYRDFTQTRMRK